MAATDEKLTVWVREIDNIQALLDRLKKHMLEQRR